MNDDDFKEWVTAQRVRVEEYLRARGISEPMVGAWPAFEAAPHFAIWVVESKKAPGKVGWWAFSGDIPTDYVSEEGECHPRSALRSLLDRWRAHLVFLNDGRQPPDATWGDGTNLKELGALLEKRIGILDRWLHDDAMWEDR